MPKPCNFLPFVCLVSQEIYLIRPFWAALLIPWMIWELLPVGSMILMLRNCSSRLMMLGILLMRRFRILPAVLKSILMIALIMIFWRDSAPQQLHTQAVLILNFWQIVGYQPSKPQTKYLAPFLQWTKQMPPVAQEPSQQQPIPATDAWIPNKSSFCWTPASLPIWRPDIQMLEIVDSLSLISEQSMITTTISRTMSIPILSFEPILQKPISKLIKLKLAISIRLSNQLWATYKHWWMASWIQIMD